MICFDRERERYQTVDLQYCFSLDLFDECSLNKERERGEGRRREGGEKEARRRREGGEKEAKREENIK